jgi:hypothetical protein
LANDFLFGCDVLRIAPANAVMLGIGHSVHSPLTFEFSTRSSIAPCAPLAIQRCTIAPLAIQLPLPEAGLSLD